MMVVVPPTLLQVIMHKISVSSGATPGDALGLLLALCQFTPDTAQISSSGIKQASAMCKANVLSTTHSLAPYLILSPFKCTNTFIIYWNPIKWLNVYYNLYYKNTTRKRHFSNSLNLIHSIIKS